MTRNIPFLLILFLLTICQPVVAGNASTTYLPFNPLDETSAHDVTDYFFWDMGNRVKLNYAFLALEKNKKNYKVAEEIYNRTGYQEFFELDLPLGRINVYTYLQEFLGITVPSSEKVSLTEVNYYDCEMNNKGKITLTKKDKKNTYYLLQFETNGANIPFIDNPEVKVVALIFLKKGIPILGIKNSKYYSLININGQWIRTNAIDQVEIKNESISDADQLLKDRPWTKLTRYIIAEDSKDLYTDAALSYSDLHEGLLVLVKKDNYYYPASVSTVYNKKIYILFLNADFNDIFDDDSALCPLENLKPFFWQQGTKINARMEYSEKWINSTIWEIDIDDERAKIFIEDGDIPMWVSLGDCRQPLESSGTDDPDDYIADDDEGDESEDYDYDYADNTEDIVDKENDYDDSYAEMDVAWEELLEYLEEQGIDISDLSDEEFMELMDKMYGDL